MKEGELKIGKRQGKCLGKDGGNGGENNDGVGNGIGDIYNHNRQQLTLVPNSVKIIVCLDKCHEGIAS